MKLTFVRHGLPRSAKAADGERADPDLHPDGARQADALAMWLAQEEIDRVFVSPARRAQQTAAPLCRELDLQPETVADLDEYDRDSSEYITIEEMRRTGHPAWGRLARGEHPDGPEASTVFVGRVSAAVEDLVVRCPGQHIVLVCHGGVINAYLGQVLGLSRLMWFSPDYTSVSRVVAARGGDRTLLSVNETAHLSRALSAR